eukprot:1151905-Pelagomonas_calceolata.AAC.8
MVCSTQDKPTQDPILSLQALLFGQFCPASVYASIELMDMRGGIVCLSKVSHSTQAGVVFLQ